MIIPKKNFKEEIEEKGILLINKPYDWTSFDVIKKLRGIFKIRKIGHAGTLDPYATGLLLVCIGPHTKKINKLQDLDKTYRGEIILGKSTPSYDLETECIKTIELDPHILTHEYLASAITHFTGKISQQVPLYSAIKVEGKRLYKIARGIEKSESIDLPIREVMIHDFKILSLELPIIKFEIKCSKGTFIRSIANDLGEYLGVGGCLKSLVRTAIGEYSLSDAYDLRYLSNLSYKLSSLN